MGDASVSSVAKIKSIKRVSVINAGQSDNNFVESNISGDGHYVVFSSNASNLVAGDENGRSDIFIYDREEAKREGENCIKRLSVNKIDPREGGNYYSSHPVISANGNYVVFVSAADNLVDNDENDENDVFIATLASDYEIAEAGQAKADEAKDEATGVDTIEAAWRVFEKVEQGAAVAADAGTATRSAAEEATAGSAADEAATAAEAAARTAVKDLAETAKILADKAEALAIASKEKAQTAKVKADGAQDQTTAQQAVEAAKTAAAEADKAKGFAQAAKETAAAAQAGTDPVVQQLADDADKTAGTAMQTADEAKAIAKDARAMGETDAAKRIPGFGLWWGILMGCADSFYRHQTLK